MASRSVSVLGQPEGLPSAHDPAHIDSGIFCTSFQGEITTVILPKATLREAAAALLCLLHVQRPRGPEIYSSSGLFIRIDDD